MCQHHVRQNRNAEILRCGFSQGYKVVYAFFPFVASRFKLSSDTFYIITPEVTRMNVTVPPQRYILHRFGDCGHIFLNTSNLIAYNSVCFSVREC